MKFSGKNWCKHVFPVILKVVNLGLLECALCLLKDDMTFVSGFYRIEDNDFIEKSGLIVSKS